MEIKEQTEKGAFQIARKMFDGELWLNKPSTWKVIWIYILGRVNFEESKTCKRGEGFFQWSKELSRIGEDITDDMIKKASRYFRESGMIGTKRSTRGVYIKVLNYNIYQTFDTYRSTNTSTKKALEKHYDSKQCNNEKNIPAKQGSLSNNEKTMKKNTFGKYKEDMPSDSMDTIIDSDSGEVQKDKMVGVDRKMKELIEWASKRSFGGKPFLNIVKQRVAISNMKKVGISPNEIMNRWAELEVKDYYVQNGLDFMSVANSFDKKR